MICLLINNLHEKLLGAIVNSIENGENGIQPAIMVTSTDNHNYIITITNSHKFLITEEL